jgi:hypothetical protein
MVILQGDSKYHGHGLQRKDKQNSVELDNCEGSAGDSMRVLTTNQYTLFKLILRWIKHREQYQNKHEGPLHQKNTSKHQSSDTRYVQNSFRLLRSICCHPLRLLVAVLVNGWFHSITVLRELGVLVNSKRYVEPQFISPKKGFCYWSNKTPSFLLCRSRIIHFFVLRQSTITIFICPWTVVL